MHKQTLTPLVFSAVTAFAATSSLPSPTLIDAARNNDPKTLRALLAQKPDVNARSGDGSTALLWIAHWNDAETADLLLHNGADPNVANEFRMTPLSEACTDAGSPLVRLLLKNGANPNTPIATGETPLMTCAKSGSADAVRMLVEFGAAVNAKEPKQSQTALMWAAAERHPDVVKALLEAHADLAAHTKQGFTALHFAARTGDLESVKLLLAAGVDVNIRTHPDAAPANDVVMQLNIPKSVGTGGYTPLLVAVMRAQSDVALSISSTTVPTPTSLTLASRRSTGPPPNWRNFTANPVYGFNDPMAGIPDRQARIKLVKTLLARGTNVNARMTKPQPGFAGGYLDANGATAFLLAASANDLEMMHILLDAGADPEILSATKASAIMAAAGLNHSIGEDLVTEPQALETVKILLSLGVDPKGRNHLTAKTLSSDPRIAAGTRCSHNSSISAST